ncbi:hypothetical protein EV175_002558, partial [Coemansia sp. RSA 1933]
MQDIPDSVIEGGVGGLTVAELCRKKREFLFRDSTLKKEDPDFFEQHFCKHPVIYLSFAQCKVASFDEFIVQLSAVMVKVFKKARHDIQGSGIELLGDADEAMQTLGYIIGKYERSCDEPAYILGCIGLAKRIFNHLSTLVRHHYGCRYILLADEYDVPFITVYQSNWPADQKQDALTVLKGLFGFMFKDNEDLEKGLMAGVFPISLGDLGSGANNFYDVTMVPTKQDEYVDPALIDPSEHAMDGSDELIDSFGFNCGEVRSMAEIVLAPHEHLHDHVDAVTRTIKEWYNGYQFDRFSEKYNP